MIHFSINKNLFLQALNTTRELLVLKMPFLFYQQ